MRLAVISDIHSNLAALQAVIEDLKSVRPDAVVVAGDFINRGPQPREVLVLLHECGWPRLRGNHEDYVIAQCREFEPGDLLANPIWQPARWTAEQLDKRSEELESLPLTMTMQAPNGSDVLIAHGTPQVNSDGVFGKTTDDELRQMLGDEPPSLFVCAHTHASLMRRVDETLIVNVGAVGLPFNGDSRAQYGVFTWKAKGWQAELRALDYDREQTYRAFEDGGFLDGGGPLARVIMKEVETARPHLGPWVRDFGDDVRAGNLSVTQATERYLADLAPGD